MLSGIRSASWPQASGASTNRPASSDVCFSQGSPRCGVRRHRFEATPNGTLDPTGRPSPGCRWPRHRRVRRHRNTCRRGAGSGTGPSHLRRRPTQCRPRRRHRNRHDSTRHRQCRSHCRCAHPGRPKRPPLHRRRSGEPAGAAGPWRRGRAASRADKPESTADPITRPAPVLPAPPPSSPLRPRPPRRARCSAPHTIRRPIALPPHQPPLRSSIIVTTHFAVREGRTLFVTAKMPPPLLHRPTHPRETVETRNEPRPSKTRPPGSAPDPPRAHLRPIRPRP